LLEIQLICVGRMKERWFVEAAAEYMKRLSAYCRIAVTESPETATGKNPSEAEISAALDLEYSRMKIPPRSVVIALCIEGEKMGSEEFSARLNGLMNRGASRLVFIVGGSHGLSPELKRRADMRLSMSDMTFPHHLARVMLLEQLYRAFNISEGGRYHK
jgi:23S rRNA (pseudouridine1915-N3)-methyltransferase